jgi:hypothetical protein
MEALWLGVALASVRASARVKLTEFLRAFLGLEAGQESVDVACFMVGAMSPALALGTSSCQ